MISKALPIQGSNQLFIIRPKAKKKLRGAALTAWQRGQRRKRLEREAKRLQQGDSLLRVEESKPEEEPVIAKAPPVVRAKRATKRVRKRPDPNLLS